MTVPPTRESLLQFLTGRARSASDGRLMLDIAIGALAAAALLLWRPWGWKLALSVAMCLSAFGAWGVTDRELEERADRTTPTATLLRAARAASAVVGWAALAAFMLVGIALALGEWKS